MRFVRQNDVKSAKWAGFLSRRGGGRGRGGGGRGGVRGGLAVLAAAVIASGCGGGGGAGGEGGREASERGSSGAAPGTAGPAHGQERGQGNVHERGQGNGQETGQETGQERGQRRFDAARVAAAKRWGLAEVPLLAPAPPARKPVPGTREGFEVDGHQEDGLPPVFTTVPTRDKVLFLTIDDGAEKDPEFLRMMSELDVPYTAFLSDYLVKEDYGYFERMRDKGVALNNHTLNHRHLPSLSYDAQKREICGMQDVIEKRYGKRPTLFRPPYGNYDRDTLRAAKACGIAAVPLWNEEVFVDRWDYRESDRRLRPGDIVLTHFRGKSDWNGTMPDMIRRFLNHATTEGYAVARLEDYL
ncbi:polysaccharide deacetylase family protein [Streptomyces phaeolivaceus]|uniref:Polysaccharide deacetylase family protein n=1 Tax=Streptomyces phaeolivaceus TaxID=2653200 RepID=A0A5P8KB42_9ACTN|nr:polysaccharide deacetylase family protein [Streptomyces phaeolivaceus]QFQ99847.1 polysaccharide deacetylase family protein [Streptomyces phaeolivaceus]